MSLLSDKFQFCCFASFKFVLLVVLDVVHDLGDTVLVSGKQGAGYNRVQAVEDLQREGDTQTF